MKRDFFLLAFGNLRHKGLRSWLTMLGIFIGIAAVVSLISLGAGLQNAILGQFGTLSVDRLTIQNQGAGFGPPGSTVVEKLNKHDLALIESVSGVKQVVTRLVRGGKIEYNKAISFEYLVDIPEEKEDVDFVYDSFSIKPLEGRLLRADDHGKVILGYGVATSDQFGKDIEVGKNIIIEGKSFEVVGILQKASSFQVNSVIFMTNKDLKDILSIDDEYDIIVAQVSDKDEIELVANRIEEKLRKDRDLEIGEEDFSVETPLQALNSVNTILNIVNAIVGGIAMISLLVGGIGIANTMYTSVLERTKEIGVMKAIGAKNSDILTIFLIESGLLGLIGGIIGAIIGLLISLGISSFANQALGENLFIIEISYSLLFGSIFFAFIVGIISGTIPAYQASKTNVVEAIRGK